MVERQDIDALLISALYGELTPAEETRLAAHLESHPADRTALADLTRARDAVRESRILQVQLEPPQSVSALLLQEAARRAPAHKGDEKEGWLQRFFRSFMAHPAMAAAAMLVLVIGVATMVAKRKGASFVDSAEPAQPALQESASAPAAAAGSNFESNTKDTTVNGTGAGFDFKTELAAPEGQGSAYRVGLADDLKAGPTEVAKEAEGKADGNKGAEAPKPVVVAKPPPVRAAGPAHHDGYVELRKQDQAPKDFAEPPAKAKREMTANDGDARDVTIPTTTTLDGNADKFSRAPGGMVGGGAAATGAPATAQPPSPPPAPRMPAPTSPPREATRADRAEKAAIQQAPSAATARAPVEDKPADSTTAWAQTQHKQLIAQVKAGNCQDAANLAVELSNRAPSYYQQNVANDRSVKQCLAYITAEREKADEQRAAKNRASATKRAADEPARAKAAPAKPTSTSK